MTNLTTDQHRDLGQRLVALQHESTMIHEELSKTYGDDELPAMAAKRVTDAAHALRNILDARLVKEHPGRASREIYGLTTLTT